MVPLVRLCSAQSIAQRPVSQEVAYYLQLATATATRRAYQGDLQDFLLWGGCIPSSPAMLAGYLAERAARHA